MIRVYKNNSSIKFIIENIYEDFAIRKQKNIFIKPNLGGRYPIIEGENTASDIVGALCEICIEGGCEEIVLGHGALLNFGNNRYDFKTLLKHSQMIKLEKYKKVKFLDLDNSNRVKINIKGFEMSLPEILTSHAYVNLCCLKTHMETTVSLAIKNQMGLLLAKDRMLMHRTDLSRYLAYLGMAAKPFVNIIDGRIGMEGNGPHHGKPKRADIVMAGNNMVEIDSLACLLIGIDYNSATHIKNAIEEKVGSPVKNEDFDNIFKKFSTKFEQPSVAFEKYRFLTVWPNSACSGCIFSLSDSHKKIKRNPIKLLKFIKKLIKANRIDIVLGKDAERYASKYSDEAIFIGNCTKDFAGAKKGSVFVPGCPPEIENIMRALLE